MKTLILIASLLLATDLHAVDCPLSWPASTDTNTVGYGVFWGTSSGDYSSWTNVGNVTNYVLKGLVSNQLYFIVIKACDGKGEWTPVTSEGRWSAPLPPFSVPMVDPTQPQPFWTMKPVAYEVCIANRNIPMKIQMSEDLVTWTTVASSVWGFRTNVWATNKTHYFRAEAYAIP